MASRGGKREGAGRKPTLDKPIMRSMMVEKRHAEMIATWAQTHGTSESEAIRRLIEAGFIATMRDPGHD